MKRFEVGEDHLSLADPRPLGIPDLDWENARLTYRAKCKQLFHLADSRSSQLRADMYNHGVNTARVWSIIAVHEERMIECLGAFCDATLPLVLRHSPKCLPEIESRVTEYANKWVDEIYGDLASWVKDQKYETMFHGSSNRKSAAITTLLELFKGKLATHRVNIEISKRTRWQAIRDNFWVTLLVGILVVLLGLWLSRDSGITDPTQQK